MESVQIITILGIVAANIGTTIGMFVWATNHAGEERRASEQRTDRLLEAIHQEMRDFHQEMKNINSRRCVAETKLTEKL